MPDTAVTLVTRPEARQIELNDASGIWLSVENVLQAFFNSLREALIKFYFLAVSHSGESRNDNKGLDQGFPCRT